MVNGNKNQGVGIYSPEADAFAAGYSVAGAAGCAIWTMWIGV